MTTEEQIEEILYEAHAYGIRNEVMFLAKKLMDDGTPRMEAYHTAFNTLIE